MFSLHSQAFNLGPCLLASKCIWKWDGSTAISIGCSCYFSRSNFSAVGLKQSPVPALTLRMSHSVWERFVDGNCSALSFGNQGKGIWLRECPSTSKGRRRVSRPKANPIEGHRQVSRRNTNPTVRLANAC